MRSERVEMEEWSDLSIYPSIIHPSWVKEIHGWLGTISFHSLLLLSPLIFSSSSSHCLSPPSLSPVHRPLAMRLNLPSGSLREQLSSAHRKILSPPTIRPSPPPPPPPQSCGSVSAPPVSITRRISFSEF